MIDYPNKLDIIFDKLKLFNIKPIIVGGYIRDKLLSLDSKDIDIELYGIDSLEKLEKILTEFGSLNSVGKSFGVAKLRFFDLDLDFSLPRSDSKMGTGHRGFKVTTDKNLDFKTAASRRDFTINAMGYDVEKKLLLDPFFGLKDLELKILRAVDLDKFAEDPLRVLRAVGFSTRFHLEFDAPLFEKCKNMIKTGVLNELASERIFEEFKKFLLKSQKPSEAFLLLQNLGAFSFFSELNSLKRDLFHITIKALDSLRSIDIEDEKEKLTLMLALICRNFTDENRDMFLDKLTKDVKMIRDIKLYIELSKEFKILNATDFSLYHLASKIELRKFLLFLDASFLGEKTKEIESIKTRAKILNTYNKPMGPLIQGKDLISLGLKPSKEFSKILDKCYVAQMRALFSTKECAIAWLKENLL